MHREDQARQRGVTSRSTVTREESETVVHSDAVLAEQRIRNGRCAAELGSDEARLRSAAADA